MQVKLTRTAQVLLFTLMLATTSVVSATPSNGSTPQDDGAALIAELRRSTGDKARVSRHAETGLVRFIGTTTDRPIGPPAGLGPNARPEQAARAFLARYGKLFGLVDHGRDLVALSERALEHGSIVRFQQLHNGVPVFAGELTVNLDGAGNILSAAGELLPDLARDTTPNVAADAASVTALQTVIKEYGVAVDTLVVSTPELTIHNAALIGGPGTRVSRLVWKLEVISSVGDPIRELILVDAERGSIVLSINQIAHAKVRRVCDFNNAASDANACGSALAPFKRLEGQAASGIAEVDKAYDYSGDTYDFFFNRFGRDSLDGKGMALISAVRYCNPSSDCPFLNAYWDGAQMTYGDGFAGADDVDGHELSHGVTEFTSGLLYYYQSGAINESLSDVFGEYMDQTNGKGNDADAVRWLLGEDLPASFGVIRNMKDPASVPAGFPAPYFNPSPDKMTSDYYSDDGSDSGGVHTNSAINNKVAYLIVDGGTFNGKTISSLGVGSTVAAERTDALSKAGKLYYQVEDQLLSSGSDYQDLYDYLYQGCLSLVGTRAKATTGALSSPFTMTNCDEVREATQAVEMDKQPVFVSSPEAAMCDTTLVPIDLWVDDLETTSGNWSMTPATGDNRWFVSNDNANSGMYSYWAPNAATTTDLRLELQRNVVLPTTTQLGTRKVYLHFNHWYGFEAGWSSAYDGGTVEYATVSGTTVGPWTAMDALPAVNGFNTTVSGSFGNPLGGRRAFGFHSYGYQSSRFDLTSLAGSTATALRFRFRVGTDSDVSHDGWEIDDVRVYACTAAPANPLAPNLIKNGAFEFQWDNNTFVDGWTASDKFTRSTSVPLVRKTGMFSGRLSDRTKTIFTVEQKVPVSAGTSYTFTGNYMIPANASDVFWFGAQVVWMNSAGTAIQAAVPLMPTRTTHTSGVWTPVSAGELTAPAGATQAAIRLAALNLGNAAQTAPGTVVYVDDFSFRQ